MGVGDGRGTLGSVGELEGSEVRVASSSEAMRRKIWHENGGSGRSAHRSCNTSHVHGVTPSQAG